jgi:DUF4097 and DUF4098 domain-containing protein YvlB
MKSVLSALAALSAAGTLSACVVVDSQAHITREEKRFTVSGVPDLTLTTFDGAIEVRSAGDAKTIVVEIEKRGATQEGVDQLRIETKQDGNQITIEVKRPSREIAFFGVGSTPTAKLIVTMPREGNVTAKSGDGSIKIEEVHGRLDLRTGDGSIRGRDIGGQVTVATGDGAVTLDGANGDLDVDTGDGGVAITGTLGTVKLHTGDGAITLRAAAGTRMTGDWSLTTGDGSVSLYLPSDFSAELDARSGDGSIRNELTAERDSGESSGRHDLRTRLGAGGKTLRIRTSDGSIRLKSN